MEKTINSIKDDILKVRYKGKVIAINVTKELSIDDYILNKQLKDIPSNYAFLCLIRDRYIMIRDKLEREKNIAYSNAWLYYKDSDNKLNNDAAANKALVNPKYLSIEKRYLKSVAKANKLISICRAYESRERIIQTLSANLRKQQ